MDGLKFDGSESRPTSVPNNVCFGRNSAESLAIFEYQYTGETWQSYYYLAKDNSKSAK